MRNRALQLAQSVALRLGSAFALLCARRDARKAFDGREVRRLLVVCYGNIYRSALAGAVLETRLASSVEVRSAGFHPVEGRPSPERHISLCSAYGVSLQQHRSRLVRASDLEWADLIVLMDRHNWAALRRLGAAADKILWLGALLPQGPIEIRDPYGLSDEHARRIVERLLAATERLAERMAAASRKVD